MATAAHVLMLRQDHRETQVGLAEGKHKDRADVVVVVELDQC